jgi:hypothetical protein
MMSPSRHSNDAWRACEAEIEELTSLARSLASHAPAIARALNERLRAFHRDSREEAHPADAERHAEAFARDLRRQWLQYAAAATASVYRSPTEAQQARLAANPLLETYGYERELSPDVLERRCDDFFPRVPEGWRAEHLLFSSGQAALTVALLSLQRRDTLRKLHIVHLGGYFETRALLEALPGWIEVLPIEQACEAHCVIVEPIACDGRFTRANVREIARTLAGTPNRERTVIVDSTLMGRTDNANALLTGHMATLRVCSGLKLFQAGLELANVGILTVFLAPGEAAAPVAHARQLRTLTGAGLRSADAVALEAPWVFDADLTSKYESAVFANNADLVRAVAQANRLFEPVMHPALCGGQAPYCVFRLTDPSDEAYRALEAHLGSLARERRLSFDRGGSFGFRGHRFEVVRPDSVDAPFLRVAMGRRGGWSTTGVIEALTELAERESVPTT